MIPARIREHPVQVLFAVGLLMALLFGSADRRATEAAQPSRNDAARAADANL